MMRLTLGWLWRWLEHPHLPLHLAALAVLLCAPSLWNGFLVDDHMLRLYLSDPPLLDYFTGSPLRTFAFLTGDPEFLERSMVTGSLPWWTSPDFRIAFFRPLTGISHWIDFRLWPDRPWLMHAHSLAWLAAVVAAAATLYRQVLGASWIAGLAALLFALDDAHGFPAMWIANRNALISVAFGLLAVIAHDAWRRHRSRTGAITAPLAFAAALLGGEMALGTGAFLLAYALFLDRGPWGERVASLVPTGAVGIAWLGVYTGFGYGASASWLYIDPTADPGRFAAAVIERGPVLLAGLWSLPSDLYAMLSPPAARWLWLGSCAVLALFAVFVVPLLRRDRSARFFATGAVLAALPACATFPSDRLMFLAGLGGMGLLAQLLGGVFEWPAWTPPTSRWRRPARALAVALAVAHIPLAPLGMLQALSALTTLERAIDRSTASYPTGPQVVGRWIMVVNTPTFYITAFPPTISLLEGAPIADRGLVLGSGIEPTLVLRPDPHTLVVRPEGGFMERGGTPRPGREHPPAADPRYMLTLFDRLVRGSPMAAGDALEIGGVLVTVLSVTNDGRPHEVAFRFPAPLEDPTYRWLQWGDGRYQPFTLPPVGSSVALPAPDVELVPIGIGAIGARGNKVNKVTSQLSQRGLFSTTPLASSPLTPTR